MHISVTKFISDYFKDYNNSNRVLCMKYLPGNSSSTNELTVPLISKVNRPGIYVASMYFPFH